MSELIFFIVILSVSMVPVVMIATHLSSAICDYMHCYTFI